MIEKKKDATSKKFVVNVDEKCESGITGLSNMIKGLVLELLKLVKTVTHHQIL